MTIVLAILKALALDFLSSKKAMAMGSALLVAAAARFGFHLDGATIITFLASVSAYVLGQGVADHGKEAALITAASIPAQGVLGGSTMAAYDKARLAFLGSKLPVQPVTPGGQP